MKTKVILIPGTNAWKEGQCDWWQEGAPFYEYLAGQTGIDIVGRDHDRPFVWSTALDGLWGSSKLRTWRAAGLNLFAYAVPPQAPDRHIPSEQLVLVAHSHALQVALFALAAGLKARALISIGSPVRKDMMGTAAVARMNVRHWVHLHGGSADKWQWLGEIGDGVLGIVREHPLADENWGFPALNHGDLLRDPKFFHYVHQAITESVNG